MKNLLFIIALLFLIPLLSVASTPSGKGSEGDEDGSQQIIIYNYIVIMGPMKFDHHRHTWIGVFYISRARVFPFAIAFVDKPDFSNSDIITVDIIYMGFYYNNRSRLPLWEVRNWEYVEKKERDI